MGIGRYLTHEVDIVHVTMTKGVRTTTTSSDVASRVTEQVVTERGTAGEFLHYTKTVVFFKGDIVIAEDDCIVIDGKERPVTGIARLRKSPNAIHHLEVDVS